MLPSVSITELDGALGTLPTGLKAFAVAGVASAGTANTPAAYARTKDVVAAFGSGPLVQLACHMIKVTGKPVVCVKTGNTTVGTHTDIVVTGVTGTSVVTITSGDTNPDDDYEPYLKVITGGTIGVAGIVLQWSLDGGRTLSANTALGTATSFVFPNSGGIGYSFAAGTLVAGDVVTSLAKAPNFSSGEITSACNALFSYGGAWEALMVAGPLDDTLFDAIELAFASKPEKWFCGQFRMPTAGESDATYQAAFNTAFSADATTRGGVCFGSCELTSAVDGKKYRRPSLYPVAAQLYRISEEEDAAKPDLGALPGVSITDQNGNPKHHDELINPGADDLRAITLRTFEDGTPNGVYITNPRLLSAGGSDFEFIQHRRVMALARAALRVYFTMRLSKEILVDKNTGFILREVREEINTGATEAMGAVLRNKPKASDWQFTLSETDNVLSTKTLTGQAAIVPLAYAKLFQIELGFRNPALVVRSV